MAANIIEQKIEIHLCQMCRNDFASGLDRKGYPKPCRSCGRVRHPKKSKSGNRAKGRR